MPQYAHRESHPARGGDKGLHPWVAVRFGELLASDPWVDLVYDQIEESGVDEASVIREPFESAPYQNGISAPALADIGVSCSRRRSNPCTRLQSAWRPGAANDTSAAAD
ncbi:MULTISPECIES: hypothetical protein [Actinomadura]|uniref:hypothetical protein n=1 Tax=Actinomadura TaxID=1988 RepID=UPI0003AD4171|nr:hypothetical protein [Actinomadura madurae]